MQPSEQDPEWLVTQQEIEQMELEHTCGLNTAEIDELVEYGVLLPQRAGADGRRRFSAECVEPLRQAARLRHYYDLDLFAVGLVSGYLTRIEHLEQRIRALHAQLPHPGQCGARGA